MTNTEFNTLVNETKARFDSVLDMYKDRDYTEIVGRIGGDVITFRVYKSGMICER